MLSALLLRQNLQITVAMAAAFLLATPGLAVVRYVAPTGGNISPYTNWTDASVTIQPAVDVSLDGDVVLVSNGTYNTGATYFLGSNRVVITKALSVESVNGPAVTFIAGQGPLGTNAVRCVYLTNGAQLVGFTLTNGYSLSPGFTVTNSGGGALCESNAVLSNCVFTGCSAARFGGGAYRGTLRNCTFIGNSSQFGGGCDSATLIQDCRLIGNMASASGGGAYAPVLVRNSLFASNAADFGGGTYLGTLLGCTNQGNRASNGGATAYSSSTGCVFIGNSADLGGGSYYGTHHNGLIRGNTASNFGGGGYFATMRNCTVISNTALFGGGADSSTNIGCIFSYNLASNSGGGIYAGVASNCQILRNTAIFSGGGSGFASLFNCTNSGNTAEQGGGAYFGTLRQCVLSSNLAVWGGGASVSMVTNSALFGNQAGYGGGTYYGTLQNCSIIANVASNGGGGGSIATLRNCTVTSNTALLGGGAYFSTNVGCVFSYNVAANDGGGLYSGVASNCLIVRNKAVQNGGGSASVTLFNCTNSGNSADSGGGAYFGTLRQCILSSNTAQFGGGTAECTSTGCTFIGNSAHMGGGAYFGTLQNDLIIGNTATNFGGGAYSSTITNSTISGNMAYNGGGAYEGLVQGCALISNTASNEGGGAWGSLLRGCTVTSNSAEEGAGVYRGTNLSCAISYNSASGQGGGMHSAVSSNSLIAGNVAQNGGGGYDSVILYGMVSNNFAYGDGGGLFGGMARNCWIRENLAHKGGGCVRGLLMNSFITGNAAREGGGAGGGIGGGTYRSTNQNCTLSGNSAGIGGGSYEGKAVNSILYYNRGFRTADNFESGDFTNCCTVPLPPGAGNISNAPALVHSGNPHLAFGSPCINEGNNAYATGADIDGEPRIAGGMVDIGGDEFTAGGATGNLAVVISVNATSAVVNEPLSFEAGLQGNVLGYGWTWGDGTSNGPEFQAQHAYVSVGNYSAVLTAWNNDQTRAATVSIAVVQSFTNYVSLSGSHVHPFLSWATAATNIQDAIEAAVVGGTVQVAPGVYSNGMYVKDGARSRVGLYRPVAVVASNADPALTVIAGQGPPTNAIRGAYVGEGSVLSGFTLRGGWTRFDGDEFLIGSGGGVWAEPGGIISNCVIRNNRAWDYGGGTYGGTLWNCLIISNNATFGGGTIRGMAAQCSFYQNTASSAGGGAYYGNLQNCLIISNTAFSGGGGAYSEFVNCQVAGNVAQGAGGGAYKVMLRNCSVLGNTADTGSGGGTYLGTSLNSIVYYNTALLGGDNFVSNAFNNSCSSPLPDGSGNFSNVPGLTSLFTSHLVSNSPCINRGNNVHATGTDLDGEPRIVNGIVDVGADEFQVSGATGLLEVAIQTAYTTAVINTPLSFQAKIKGKALDYLWTWGDGTTNGADLIAAHSFGSAGNYPVVLTAWNLELTRAATVTVSILSGFTNYVSLSGGHLAPFTNWTTAASNIQAAIDAAVVGGTALVAPGRYDRNEYVAYNMRNRVGLYKPLLLLASNANPSVTVIEAEGALDDNSMRCVYVGNGAVISGFTLTNGATKPAGFDLVRETYGGGAWCEKGGTISNCVLRNNSAEYGDGGGVYNGFIRNCDIRDNSAVVGGGAAEAELEQCVLLGNQAFGGGGADHCIVRQSSIIKNSASAVGGGASYSTLQGCLIISNTALYGAGAGFFNSIYQSLISGNSASNSGGGDYLGVVKNCLIVGNSASNGGGGILDSLAQSCTIVSNRAAVFGGGTYGGDVRNSIVFNNAAPSGPNHSAGTNYSYSCTAPLPGGTNNITGDPQFLQFAAGDYRLKPSSPCIDRGINEPWMIEADDLEGNSRIVNGTVDMGAYELVFEASLKNFLQGAYNTNDQQMTSGLTNVLPLASPYAAALRTVEAIPSNVTDWISVELRPNSNSAPAYVRSAFLRNDGLLVNDNGAPPVTLESGTGSYYVVIKHRNHLAAMTAAPIPFTNRTFSYDFTVGSAQFYGGTNGSVELQPGIWGMPAGDADGNGEILPVDTNIWQTQEGM